MPASSRDDYFHLWRYIGSLLGIDDEFNVARDRILGERCFREFLVLVPLLNKSVRPSCIALVNGTVAGFGTYTFASREFFASLLYGAALEHRDMPLSADWSQVPKPPRCYIERTVRELRPDVWLLPGGSRASLVRPFVSVSSHCASVQVGFGTSCLRRLCTCSSTTAIGWTKFAWLHHTYPIDFIFRERLSECEKSALLRSFPKLFIDLGRIGTQINVLLHCR